MERSSSIFFCCCCCHCDIIGLRDVVGWLLVGCWVFVGWLMVVCCWWLLVACWLVAGEIGKIGEKGEIELK